MGYEFSQESRKVNIHTQDNLWFINNGNGTVTIKKLGVFEQTIDCETWLSIISSMSIDSGGYNAYQRAINAHLGNNYSINNQ